MYERQGDAGATVGDVTTKPRLTISLRNAMQVFLDEDGNLVADRLRQALQDPDGRVGVAAVRVALEYHVKTGGTAKQGKGLVIV